MRKDQQEELRRLEQALLETEQQEAPDPWDTEDADDWLEEIFLDGEDAPQDYNVYNADEADVDLDSYSEAVLEAPKKRGCATWLLLIFLALLGYGAYWFLKKRGVL